MIIPYLHFQGNCEEALRFYASTFGGKVEHLSRFTEATGSPALLGKVMHGMVTFGDSGGISGADQEKTVDHGKSMDLMVHCESVDEAKHFCTLLAEEGHEISPLNPFPPPDDGGMGAAVQDKYGYRWIITAPNTKG